MPDTSRSVADGLPSLKGATIRTAFVVISGNQIKHEIPVDDALRWMDAAMSKSNGNWPATRQAFLSALDKYRRQL